jgi:hypothetical protein
VEPYLAATFSARPCELGEGFEERGSAPPFMTASVDAQAAVQQQAATVRTRIEPQRVLRSHITTSPSTVSGRRQP